MSPATPVPANAADGALLAAVRDALADAADPAKAPAMQAYMKSSMPYRGVQLPLLRRLLNPIVAAHPLGSFAAWHDTVLALWREAAFREERYAAITLTGQRCYQAFRTSLEALPLYEELIVTGAWWDLVDEVAEHRVGDLLRAHPASMRPVILAWSRDDDLWKRRSAIICQIFHKEATDLDLLSACIEPNLADRDFFIRKAIGWALREYAKTDPAEVARYVAAHHDQLSGLSRREALKHIGG